MLRLAVLISGRGSNMQALIDYTSQSDVPASIVAVIADNPAEGCDIAAAANIPASVINKSDFENKAGFEQALADYIDPLNVDLICLAGFMSVLSADFCQRYHGEIINIHPSLLPAYKGLDTHQRAINDQASLHGCSVHIVTAQIDAGTILAQKSVAVHADDTKDTLAARVLAEEHVIYPMVVGAFAAGLLTLEHHKDHTTPIMTSGILPGIIGGQRHLAWPIEGK
jgi:phosphoribosylglycinamide formyltransferase-1